MVIIFESCVMCALNLTGRRCAKIRHNVISNACLWSIAHGCSKSVEIIKSNKNDLKNGFFLLFYCKMTYFNVLS